MNRGDIYWYLFQPPDKRRPVLILTRDSAIPYLTTVTIVPITTTIRSIPSEVLLTEDDGLLAQCAANCDNLQTIPKAKLGSFITRLSPNKLEELRDAVMFAFGFDTGGL